MMPYPCTMELTSTISLPLGGGAEPASVENLSELEELIISTWDREKAQGCESIQREAHKIRSIQLPSGRNWEIWVNKRSDAACQIVMLPLDQQETLEHRNVRHEVTRAQIEDMLALKKLLPHFALFLNAPGAGDGQELPHFQGYFVGEGECLPVGKTCGTRACGSKGISGWPRWKIGQPSASGCAGYACCSLPGRHKRLISPEHNKAAPVICSSPAARCISLEESMTQKWPVAKRRRPRLCRIWRHK